MTAYDRNDPTLLVNIFNKERDMENNTTNPRTLHEIDREAERHARIFDALGWVAQEANGAVMGGMTDLREPNRLREALAALQRAF